MLQIWTDGTITPDEALRQAAHVLVTHFQMIAEHDLPTEALPPELQAPVEGGKTTAFPIQQKIYDMPIEELDLSVRAYNCLKRSNITKVGQVLTMNRDDLLAVRNFGEKSLNELADRLIQRRLLPAVPQQDHQDSLGSTSSTSVDMGGDEEE
jgi:DNA-directed RNA polymerase subunit alpha